MPEAELLEGLNIKTIRLVNQVFIIRIRITLMVIYIQCFTRVKGTGS